MALWKEEAPNPIIACLQLSDEPGLGDSSTAGASSGQSRQAILLPCTNHDHSLQKCDVLRVCADRGFAMHGSFVA